MSDIYTLVQTKPYLRIGHCYLYIQDGKQKKVQQLLNKFKAVKSVVLDDYEIEIHEEHIDYLDQQFLLLKKTAQYLDDAQWYISDEAGTIFKLEVKKKVFTSKQIRQPYHSFVEYYKAIFPKDTEGIFSLLKNRIYRDYPIAHNNEQLFKSLEKDVRTAVAIHPEAWYILQNYAVALSNKKNYKKAIRIERQALRVKFKINKQDDYDSLLLYSNLANSLVSDKQYDAALKCVAKAEHIVPNRGDYRILEKKAYAYLGLKNYKMVVSTCNEIIKKSLRPTDIAYAFFNKAAALTMLKRYAESAAALVAAYTMDSNLSGLAENDPENIMWFKILLKADYVKSIMGETYEYIKKFN